ncbi:MAG: acetolactate synthase large subunit [Kiloniellales bacterium]|nr:acetolactate synthase large subunit [Kiloniellales bacterium]
MKASDLFVRCLEAEGVERIFGVPGEENADLMISLLDSKIDFVLCRHEQAAAFMADAYGRLTGKPGVCLATLGPGATNLVTGVADANMDRAPLVAIIGQGSTARLHKESHQNMDSIAMFEPISKWARSILNPATIPEVVRKAFKVAQMEKPGATVIELPEDVAEAEVDLQPMVPSRTRRPAADWKAVHQAVDLILAAKDPLILAGNGTVRNRAAKQLRRLARKTGIPVVNTFMGKGAVPMDDPHCLFTIGLQGKDHILRAFKKADLIVSVGYDLVEYAPGFWNPERDKRIVHIDFEPAEIDEAYPVSVDICADVADALWQINERINEVRGEDLPLHDIGRCRELRDTIWADLTAEREDTAFPMKPQRILNDIRAALRPQDILLSDVGAHKMWVARYYQCLEQNTCLISNGFCSMGFALPGAIGAKFAAPESKVVAVCGDAGFLMNVHDLETAARLKIPLVVVVWLDGEYGLIKWKQQNHFDGRHSDLAFTNPDMELLAKSFGIWGRKVEAAADFRPTLDEALAQDGPCLIAVEVDYAENRKLTKRLGEVELHL